MGSCYRCTWRAVLCVEKRYEIPVRNPPCLMRLYPTSHPYKNNETFSFGSKKKEKKKWAYGVNDRELPFARHFTRSRSRATNIRVVLRTFFFALSARPYFPLLPLFPLMSPVQLVMICYFAFFSFSHRHCSYRHIFVSHDKSISTGHYATKCAPLVGAESLSIKTLC